MWWCPHLVTNAEPLVPCWLGAPAVLLAVEGRPRGVDQGRALRGGQGSQVSGSQRYHTLQDRKRVREREWGSVREWEECMHNPLGREGHVGGKGDERGCAEGSGCASLPCPFMLTTDGWLEVGCDPTHRMGPLLSSHPPLTDVTTPVCHHPLSSMTHSCTVQYTTPSTPQGGRGSRHR